MNTPKKGWILRPSKTRPGKFYYFNVASREAVWTLNSNEVCKMNTPKKGWILRPSKTRPGKFYYFNVASREAVWTLNSNEKITRKKENSVNVQNINNSFHSYPEPPTPPDERPSTSTSNFWPTNRKVYFQNEKYTFKGPSVPWPECKQTPFQNQMFAQQTSMFGQPPHFVTNLNPFMPTMPNVGLPSFVRTPMQLPMSQRPVMTSDRKPVIDRATQTPQIDRGIFVHTCGVPLNEKVISYENTENKLINKPKYFVTSTPLKNTNSTRDFSQNHTPSKSIPEQVSNMGTELQINNVIGKSTAWTSDNEKTTLKPCSKIKFPKKWVIEELEMEDKTNLHESDLGLVLNAKRKKLLEVNEPVEKKKPKIDEDQRLVKKGVTFEMDKITDTSITKTDEQKKVNQLKITRKKENSVNVQNINNSFHSYPEPPTPPDERPSTSTSNFWPTNRKVYFQNEKYTFKGPSVPWPECKQTPFQNQMFAQQTSMFGQPPHFVTNLNPFMPTMPNVGLPSFVRTPMQLPMSQRPVMTSDRKPVIDRATQTPQIDRGIFVHTCGVPLNEKVISYENTENKLINKPKYFVTSTPLKNTNSTRDFSQNHTPSKSIPEQVSNMGTELQINNVIGKSTAWTSDNEKTTLKPCSKIKFPKKWVIEELEMEDKTNLHESDLGLVLNAKRKKLLEVNEPVEKKKPKIDEDQRLVKKGVTFEMDKITDTSITKTDEQKKVNQLVLVTNNPYLREKASTRNICCFNTDEIRNGAILKPGLFSELKEIKVIVENENKADTADDNQEPARIPIDVYKKQLSVKDKQIEKNCDILVNITKPKMDQNLFKAYQFEINNSLQQLNLEETDNRHEYENLPQFLTPNKYVENKMNTQETESASASHTYNIENLRARNQDPNTFNAKSFMPNTKSDTMTHKNITKSPEYFQTNNPQNSKIRFDSTPKNDNYLLRASVSGGIKTNETSDDNDNAHSRGTTDTVSTASRQRIEKIISAPNPKLPNKNTPNLKSFNKFKDPKLVPFKKETRITTALKGSSATTDRIRSNFKNHEQTLKGSLKKFRVKKKNKMMQKKLTTKMDEWICTYTQIMEHLLTDTLQNNSAYVRQMNVSNESYLHESLTCLKMLYDDTKLRKILQVLLKLLDQCTCSKGKIKLDTAPNDFMKMIGCGVLLVQTLKTILPDFKVLDDYESILNCLISNIESKTIDLDPELFRSTAVCRSEIENTNKAPRRNFLKNPLVIIEYLKKHYKAWSSYDHRQDGESSQMNDTPNGDNKVVRLSGKNINMLKIDNNKSLSYINTIKENNPIVEKEAETELVKLLDSYQLNQDVTIADNVHLEDGKQRETAPRKQSIFSIDSHSEISENDKEKTVTGAKTTIDNDLSTKNQPKDKRFTEKKEIDKMKAIDIIKKTKENVDNSTRNPPRVDSTNDSGSENETFQVQTFVQIFLNELSNTFKVLYKFIVDFVQEIREEVLCEERENYFHIQSSMRLTVLRAIIKQLKCIIERESTEATSFKVTLLLQSTKDPRMSQYRQTIQKCLEQAEIFQSALRIIVCVTSGDTDAMSTNADSI